MFWVCNAEEESSNDVKSKENPKVQNYSSNPASESMKEGIRFSDTAIDFDDVKNFSNFNIIVDGLVIDCKFPDHLRKTYYELCCAQESFLHKDLLKQINLTLAVGVSPGGAPFWTSRAWKLRRAVGKCVCVVGTLC